MFLQILLLIFAVIFAFYLFALRQQKFWRKRGIPGPDPTLLKGNLDNVFGKKPAVFQLQKWTQQFGKVYGIQEGCWKKVLVTSDAEMVRQMLVDKFEYFHGRMISPLIGDVDKTELVHLFAAQGKRWKRLRTIANPAFSLANLKRVMPILDDSIRVTMDFLKEARLQGKPNNMHIQQSSLQFDYKTPKLVQSYGDKLGLILHFFTEMTFDIISRVAMGQKGTLQFRSPYLKVAQKCLNQFNNSIWDYYALLFPWVGRNLLCPFLRLVGGLLGDPIAAMLIQCRKAVEERKRQKEEENFGENEENERKVVDFIDLFLEAESKVQLTNENRAYNKTEKFERKNSTEEIVMNCFLFLLAGFDTTANSLSVIAHNLVLYPEVQQKMWEEIDAICGGVNVDEMPSYEQLAQLKYAEAVIKETLRLCPIGSSVVNRIAADTVTFGDIKLEKGIGVKAELLTLHKDKTIWGPDAGEFKPERWLDPSFVQPNAYYPFGGGPRICIGMRLSMLEQKMALVHLLRRFSLNKCPETEIKLNFTGQVVLNPNSVTVKVEQRLVD